MRSACCLRQRNLSPIEGYCLDTFRRNIVNNIFYYSNVYFAFVINNLYFDYVELLAFKGSSESRFCSNRHFRQKTKSLRSSNYRDRINNLVLRLPWVLADFVYTTNIVKAKIASGCFRQFSELSV
jgi:hypothetical protein